MSSPVPIHLAVEDELSEVVARRLVASFDASFAIGECYRDHGNGYLRRTIGGFNQAAKGTPFFVLTDLDAYPCPLGLVRDWLEPPQHPHLLFRVAVREVESWLLGDADGVAKFLGIARAKIPQLPEDLEDPKRDLIELARGSRYSERKAGIVAPARSTREQGPDYNGTLAQFVWGRGCRPWNVETASTRCPSLKRAIGALRRLETSWPPRLPRSSRAG